MKSQNMRKLSAIESKGKKELNRISKPRDQTLVIILIRVINDQSTLISQEDKVNTRLPHVFKRGKTRVIKLLLVLTLAPVF